MADALKPCPNPWCASHKTRDPEIFEAHRPILMPSRASYEWAVACPVCPLQSPWFDTEQDAIAAWNTRALSPSQDDGLIEALRGELICTLEELVEHLGDDMIDSRQTRIAELRKAGAL